MGLFDDFISLGNSISGLFGQDSSGSKDKAKGSALSLIGFGLDIAQVEARRGAAREQTRALKNEAQAVARQGGELVDENQERTRRLVASQTAGFGASGVNLVNGGGSPGSVILDSLTEGIRRQRQIVDRTNTATDRLLRQGRAIRRSANRARVLGLTTALASLFFQEE